MSGVVPGSIAVNAHHYGGLLADGLRQRLPGETVVACAARDEVPHDARVLVTLLDDPDAIRDLLTPSVEWVHVLGAGVDGFPFDALEERALTCSRGAAATAIAEWVMGAMLAYTKELPESWIDAPPERWNAASLGTLSGTTLGLVGLGAIGTAIARRALSFDMEVVAFRRTAGQAPVEGVAVLPELVSLLGRSDHVVVAAPATTHTRHLLDDAAFAALKPGVHLVNVARGSLLDQEALRRALDGGIVARATLDTVEPEPLPLGHWLYSHPAVRLSPHISWSSPDTMVRTVGLFVENLGRFRSGAALKGAVDRVAGY